MSKQKTCYECKHMKLCSLFRQVDKVVIGDHSDMVRVDTGDDPNFTKIYDRLAEICKNFEKS